VSNADDKDHWSTESASLFRQARRAHDPTPAESARLAAVLERIQAGKAEGSFAASDGADSAARAATSALLRHIGSVSLGVVCLAVATFALIRLNRPPSEPARTAKPAPTAVASPAPTIAIQPALAANDERSASAQTPSARDEAESRPRRQRRRSRAIAERQRTSRIEVPSVPEASSPAPLDNPTNVTAPKNSATPRERTAPRSTMKAAASTQETAPRATSFGSNPQQTVTPAARKADPTPPEPRRTELAMIKRIQGALRDADFVAVLALCDDHALRWPHGVFELEREGVRAIASCGENTDDAVLRAKRFLTAHPHASVAMRVTAACATQLKRR